MKKIIFLILAFFSILNAYTQNKTNAVIGNVKEKENGKPIPFINIVLKETTIGTITDAAGHFKLTDLPEGFHILMASGIGYKPQEKLIHINKNNTTKVSILLEEDVLGLQEVVVSASKNQINRKNAPLVITSIGPKLLETTQAVCVADGLDFTPGIRVESNCQNCGFTQVRMNGLEGSYSQILINSRPIFSGLAGVYGLELIPSSMIEKIEVVRGGGSAIFGGNAIAGTINIITKEPKENSFSVGTKMSSIGIGNRQGSIPAMDKILTLGGSVVSKDNNSGLFLYGYIRDRDPFDENRDEFSEIVLMKNTTIGLNTFYKPGKRNKISLDYYRINEFRRGGNKFNYLPHEADITEQLKHLINGASLTYDQFLNDSYDKIQLYAALQTIDRDSYYGAEQDPNAYGYTEDITTSLGAVYTKNFEKSFVAPSTLIAGIDNVSNYLDDTKLGSAGTLNTTLINQHVNTTGLYLQNDWKMSIAKVSLGLRYDNYLIRDLDSDHRQKEDDIKGNVLIPRANVLFHINEHMGYRISYAKGYRAPQIFDEDLHIEASGSKKILHSNSPELTQETSHTFTSSIYTDFHLKKVYGELLVEGFYTKLLNPFANEFNETETEDVFEYTRINAENGAKVYGVNVELNASLNNTLTLQLGFTLQKSNYEEAQAWGEEEESVSKNFMRTPDQYGFMAMEWSGVKNLRCSLTGTYTGSMYVPHFGLDPETTVPKEIEAINNGDVITGERLEKSESFLHIGLKLAYDVSLGNKKLEVSLGMQNIFNQIQKQHDRGVFRDAGYIYGPSKPRTLNFGLTFGNL